MTTNENSKNDSYLITSNEQEVRIKISYQKNIKEFFEKIGRLSERVSGLDLNKSDDFRKFVTELDKEGYNIYQLTKL